MFGKSSEDKMAEKQAKQAAKDKAALEKFGLDFENYSLEEMLSVKLDAPAPCRLDAPDLDLICYASADCLHQHLQVI